MRPNPTMPSCMFRSVSATPRCTPFTAFQAGVTFGDGEGSTLSVVIETASMKRFDDARKRRHITLLSDDQVVLDRLDAVDALSHISCRVLLPQRRHSTGQAYHALPRADPDVQRFKVFLGQQARFDFRGDRRVVDAVPHRRMSRIDRR